MSQIERLSSKFDAELHGWCSTHLNSPTEVHRPWPRRPRVANEASEEGFSGQDLPGEDVSQGAALELVAADVADLERSVLVR